MALSGPGEFVHLENVGTEPLHYRYLGSNHTLPTGKVVVVPWGHLDYLMGNPFLVEIDRSERLDQILRRYGCRRLEELPYSLKATDAEGDPIITIIDDPDGNYALSAGMSGDTLDPAAVQAAMRSMERQMAVMQAQLDAQLQVPGEDQAAAPDAAPQEVAVANAREKALARATGGMNDDDIISTVAPHLVPSTDVPTDGPMTDVPNRVPTA